MFSWRKVSIILFILIKIQHEGTHCAQVHLVPLLLYFPYPIWLFPSTSPALLPAVSGKNICVLTFLGTSQAINRIFPFCASLQRLTEILGAFLDHCCPGQWWIMMLVYLPFFPGCIGFALVLYLCISLDYLSLSMSLNVLLKMGMLQGLTAQRVVKA